MTMQVIVAVRVASLSAAVAGRSDQRMGKHADHPGLNSHAVRVGRHDQEEPTAFSDDHVWAHFSH
jgi:hypothetical protein